MTLRLIGVVSGFSAEKKDCIHIGITKADLQKFSFESKIQKSYIDRNCSNLGIMVDFKLKFSKEMAGRLGSFLGQNCEFAIRPRFYNFNTKEGKIISGYNFYIQDFSPVSNNNN